MNRKVRKTIHILEGLIAALFLFWCIGLFRIPKYYRTVQLPTDGQPSMYLTNHILPELHNKSQYGRPFEVVFSEQGINDVLARHIDVNSMQEAGMSDLSVSFEEDRILFVSKTTFGGFTFYPTIVLELRTDKNGRFFLKVSEVQMGKSRLPLADEIIEKKLLESFDEVLKDSKNPDFVRALFSNSMAKSVFSVNRNKVSIEGITVRKNELTAHFVPQENQ